MVKDGEWSCFLEMPILYDRKWQQQKSGEKPGDQARDLPRRGCVFRESFCESSIHLLIKIRPSNLYRRYFWGSLFYSLLIDSVLDFPVKDRELR
ncbi:MAG: hypothetical protein RLY14_3293 [Planctomycetota bacterium]|jgi:hypothetical protein